MGRVIGGNIGLQDSDRMEGGRKGRVIFSEKLGCKSKSPLLQIVACDSNLPIIYLLSIHTFCISSPSSDVIPLLQPESLSMLSPPAVSTCKHNTSFQDHFQSFFMLLPGFILFLLQLWYQWSEHFVFSLVLAIFYFEPELSSWVVLLYNSPTGVQRARPVL